ncbi:MAG TPA: hypothetical protein VHW09_25375 [Bryobacteraceae bacterium]|jgi:hypothetical protein|nr:hypothetical protein [Bryobacteraceae bacterium]
MPFRYGFGLITALLLLPGPAAASSIEINSTCVVGTCPPVSGPSDAVSFGGSVGPTAGNYLYTFGNGDPFNVSWTYSAEYDSGGTRLAVDFSVDYVGIGPSTGNDSLNLQYLQNFYDTGPWDGNYTEYIPLFLSADAGAGSTVSGELFYDGQSVGLVGPDGPGTYSGMNSTTLTGLTDPTLSADFQFIFNFNQGTVTNASASTISSDVPEPAQTLPIGIFLVLSGLYFRFASKRTRTESNQRTHGI